MVGWKTILSYWEGNFSGANYYTSGWYQMITYYSTFRPRNENPVHHQPQFHSNDSNVTQLVFFVFTPPTKMNMSPKKRGTINVISDIFSSFQTIHFFQGSFKRQ